MRMRRNPFLLKALALLLLAVLAPAQAAGCCKIAYLLSADAPAMAADHACCPKGAPTPREEAPASAPEGNAGDPCAPGTTGCCLQADPAAEATLVSEPSSSVPALPAHRPLPGVVPAAAPVRPAAAVPAASGPPPYLHYLRLLI